MNKIQKRLHSLSKDRRYMIFVGIAIIVIGLIALGSKGFAAFLAIVLGLLCLLVGYYGADMKKGMEEFKHDVMEAKDVATDLAQKSLEKEDATKKPAPKKAVKK